jgi:hypothetical protein
MKARYIKHKMLVAVITTSSARSMTASSAILAR